MEKRREACACAESPDRHGAARFRASTVRPRWAFLGERLCWPGQQFARPAVVIVRPVSKGSTCSRLRSCAATYHTRDCSCRRLDAVRSQQHLLQEEQVCFKCCGCSEALLLDQLLHLPDTRHTTDQLWVAGPDRGSGSLDPKQRATAWHGLQTSELPVVPL